MAVTKFNPNTTAFKFNAHYDPSGDGEANLFREILIEATWKHGTDIVFIERDSKLPEAVFVETLGEVLTRGTNMRFFVEQTEQWEGMGNVFSKFGLRMQQEMIAWCPKELFARTRPSESSTFYPKQGDLIYHVRANKLFEVKNIEDEVAPSFYLFGNRVVFKFTCELYKYEHSQINQTAGNGIPEIVKDLDKPIENEGDINRNVKPWLDYESENTIIDNTEKDFYET